MNPQKEIPYSIASPETVRLDVLDAIPYAYSGRRSIEITIEQPEFTSVCPMTGLPDFGVIAIRYKPKDMIIELKSLKYYLLQYRNVGIFYEHLVNRILEDLVAALSPRWMAVESRFTARGGITSRAVAVYSEDGQQETGGD